MSSNTKLDTGIPHTARVYDYVLGGKDNFKADRELGDKLIQALPTIQTSMRANRQFMARVARYLATELGIRQFLDIGTGLPTSPNLHEVVQQVDPTAGVVYVDNDPIVLVHARALLTSRPDGKTAYIDADFLSPETILAAPEIRILDLAEPVALSLIAILPFVVDDDEVHRVIDTLMEPLPAGSVLAISTATADSSPGGVAQVLAEYERAGIRGKLRGREEVQDLFRGLELLDPGVVLVHRWHPDEQAAAYSDEQVHMYGGVAVKR
jgi:S-adenosyl methyltransferase